MGLEDRALSLAAEVEDTTAVPTVDGKFAKGFAIALVTSVVIFWGPVIFFVAWLVTR
jgi:hypothetical protein